MSTPKRRHSATKRMTIADLSRWAKDTLSSKSQILIAKSKNETRTHLQQVFRAKANRKAVGSGKANVHFGDSCASKHEPNKEGKGKGRPGSPSPTGSTHRNSKGDGKGSDEFVQRSLFAFS